MSPSSATSSDTVWLSHVGHLRPWERAGARDEVQSYNTAQIKETIEELSGVVAQRLASPLFEADIETILLMSLDVSAIFRGIKDVRHFIEGVKCNALSWRLLVFALNGASYEELRKQLGDIDYANKAIETSADVVKAYVSSNTISHDLLPSMLTNVYAALTRDNSRDLEKFSRSLKIPAVPIDKSITPEYLISLEDGRKFKSLKRYLRTEHNMTPDEYRNKWNLPPDYPMVAPNYAKARVEMKKKFNVRLSGHKMRPRARAVRG